MRLVKDRMQQAVKFFWITYGHAGLAKILGDQIQRKTTQNNILAKIGKKALTALIKRTNSGGGGRSRTYDAADMSRLDSDPNYLELLTELLMEAGLGGE